MIDQKKLENILAAYKEDFHTWWPNEKYKWEAIKCFQENWNIEAEDFARMLTRSLALTKNILGSSFYYPRKMIQEYASLAPEKVRAMFVKLFDERVDIAERIENFKSASDEIHKEFGGTQKNHYQKEHAITTYLWLRFPDKYYIYKPSVVSDMARKLDVAHLFKKKTYSETISLFFELYNEVNQYVKEDNELIHLLETSLTESCHPDPELRTLTGDIGYYASKKTELKIEWFPTDYSPKISVERWFELLQDQSVFRPTSLEIMKRIKDFGGQASCSQLSEKYGENRNFYNVGSSSLAQRVAEKTGCPVMERDEGGFRWWSILYLGRSDTVNEKMNFIWRLRDELSQALEKVDLTDVKLYADPSPTFWKISHGMDSRGVPQNIKMILEQRQVISMDQKTNPKGKAQVSQGDQFMQEMKKGDFFYLCHGNSIQLLGEIITDEVRPNPDMPAGWFERDYKIITHSRDTTPYLNTKKWWTPNDNSTLIKVDNEDLDSFEGLILKPYFNITVSEILNQEKPVIGYWWLNANPNMWGYDDLKVGESQEYTLYNENGHKRRVFQHFLDAKKDDLVIGYESYPVRKIVALAKIKKEQDGYELHFEKTEQLSTPIELAEFKDAKELADMEYIKSPQGSLFKVKKSEYDYLLKLIREKNPINMDKALTKYTKSNFLSEVYMSENRYDRLRGILNKKKNVILQGAPGVGKTFVARRLAYSVMGEMDDSRIEFVQFHQNYSYEDFIMGYKPVGEGFELKNGTFYRFCQKAASQLEKEHFFIIDEINRGNMSKIFGELLMLIEADYRGTKVTLPYNDIPFSVPENVFIIGMMNTADRSLAMIDYALRRRFSFFDMTPGFETEGFVAYQNSLDHKLLNDVIDQIKLLNQDITDDRSLGKSFCIGHSYFCGQKASSEDWLRNVVDYDILPMLSEYWFDDLTSFKKWEKLLLELFE